MKTAYKTGGDKGSAEQIVKRRKKLAEMIENCHRDGIPITNKVLTDKMMEAGFYVNHSTMYRDRTALNQSSTFLEDLGEYNYSEFMKDITVKIELIETESWKLFKTKWVSKKVTKKTVGKITTTQQEISENEAVPKAMFLDIFKDCQKLKLEMLKGDNINLAVGLLSRKMQEIKEENAGLKMQLEKLNRETPAK